MTNSQTSTKRQQCECADSGCPEHGMVSGCENKASATLYRIDMADYSGTRMCEACAMDAYESGLFADAPDRHGER